VKKKKRIRAFLPPSVLSRLPWFWPVLAAGLWAWEQFAHAAKGTPLSGLIFAKGLVLLAEAAVLYGLARFPKFYFLGMFPLSWLAVSHFQWDLCAAPEYRFWTWLALFLGAEILILALPDGKKLLLPLVPLWTALVWLFKFSFLLPLAFLTAPSKRFWNAPWARWGGLATTVALYLAFGGWAYFLVNWLGLYDLFVGSRFFAFFLLGWLGLVAFDSKWKGTFRHVLFPLVLLPVGLLFWGGANPSVTFFETAILQWVLVWMAGYGWEAFREYLMDPSWHGRLVWLAMGLGLFGGVL